MEFLCRRSWFVLLGGACEAPYQFSLRPICTAVIKRRRRLAHPGEETVYSALLVAPPPGQFA